MRIGIRLVLFTVLSIMLSKVGWGKSVGDEVSFIGSYVDERAFTIEKTIKVNDNYLLIGKGINSEVQISDKAVSINRNQLELFISLLSPKGELLHRYSFMNSSILEKVCDVVYFEDRLLILARYGKYRKKRGPFPYNTILFEYSFDLGLLRQKSFEGEGYSLNIVDDDTYAV